MKKVLVRLSRFFVVFVVFVAFFLASASLSASEPYPIGWYDDFDVVDMNLSAQEGSNTLMCYPTGEYSVTSAQLDNAQAAGMNVIVMLPYYYVENKQVSSMQTFVQQWDNHPAVVGWQTFDEPQPQDPVEHDICKTAYDAIKAVSTKPVSIVFANVNDLSGNLNYYSDSYDVMHFDRYTCMAGESEFYHFEDYYDSSAGMMKPGYKSLLSTVSNTSVALNKPWVSVVQGFGRVPNTSWGRRLPTDREERFMTYWSVIHDASGLQYWARYRCDETVAEPSDPYPFGGSQWMDDVWKPLAAEINTCGLAISEGAIAGIVGNDDANVLNEVYRDPETGKYYMIALNSTDDERSVTYSFDLSVNFESAIPMFGSKVPIDIVDGTLGDSLAAYEAHVYRLVPKWTFLYGDANGDGVVSAGDFAAIQANYGAVAGGTSTSTPEPATMSLLAIGGVAILRRKRR